MVVSKVDANIRLQLTEGTAVTTVALECSLGKGVDALASVPQALAEALTKKLAFVADSAAKDQQIAALAASIDKLKGELAAKGPDPMPAPSEEPTPTEPPRRRRKLSGLSE